MNNKLYKDGQGNLIEVFSMTPTEVKFSNQGGGFLMRCSRQEFDSKFTPAAEPEYSCMVVTAEWLDQNVACYSNGKRWNGWGMPLFPFESANLVASLMGEIHYDEENDASVWRPEGEEEESYPAQHITVGNEEVKAYGIGSGSWCWNACEPASVE